MNGHVTKRGSKWEVRLELGEQDGQRCPACMSRKGRSGGRLLWADSGRHAVCPVCGGPLEDTRARRQVTLPERFATKREAEARLVRELHAGLEGSFTEPAKLTLGAFLSDHWLPQVKGNVRATTYVAYELHVRRIVAYLGGVRVQRLTTMDVDRFYSSLRTDKAARGKPLSAATVKGVHRVLHHALAKAVEWNLIVRNPADRAQIPRVARREMKTWSAQELALFLQATEGDRLNPLWRLMAATGLRRGEALGLRWTDVDLAGRSLVVRRSRKQVGYAVVEEGLKTDRPRAVPFDQGTKAALERQAAQQLADRQTWGDAWADTGHVFTREDGQPWHPDRVTKLFDAAVAAAPVSRVRLHDLRHTHATLGLAAGVHPKIMSERLGHSSIAMTLDTYSHAIPTLQDSAADLIGAVVDGALGALRPQEQGR